MPMPMRGNRRDNDQTDTDVERVQTPIEGLQGSIPGTMEGRRMDSNSGRGKDADEKGNTETGCLPSDSPLPGSDQDGGDYKITYRWSYKIGGWRRVR